MTATIVFGSRGGFDRRHGLVLVRVEALAGGRHDLGQAGLLEGRLQLLQRSVRRRRAAPAAQPSAAASAASRLSITGSRLSAMRSTANLWAACDVGLGALARRSRRRPPRASRRPSARRCAPGPRRAAGRGFFPPRRPGRRPVPARSGWGRCRTWRASGNWGGARDFKGRLIPQRRIFPLQRKFSQRCHYTLTGRGNGLTGKRVESNREDTWGGGGS